MKQNYKNHTRLIWHYHGLTFFAILALLIGSFINLSDSSSDNIYSASLICLISIILMALFFYARGFALRSQDRAIRAEENFRHFILTNKVLDNRLTMAQMIALRFASDDEFPSLAQKAADQRMSAKDIKKAIRNWRGDYYRV
jgi:hypothetical protein